MKTNLKTWRWRLCYFPLLSLSILYFISSDAIGAVEECQPLLVGINGNEGLIKDKDIDMIGMLFKEIEKKKLLSSISYKTFAHNKGSMANAYIKNYHKRCPKHNIVLMGYSWGAETAVDVAQDNKDIIKLIVTLDGVGQFDFDKPPRSLNWLNVYVPRSHAASSGVVVKTLVRLGGFALDALDCIFFIICVPAISVLLERTWLRDDDIDSSDRCEVVAYLGDPWGHENGAKNIEAGDDHCDLTGMYDKIHSDVKQALMKY